MRYTLYLCFIGVLLITNCSPEPKQVEDKSEVGTHTEEPKTSGGEPILENPDFSLWHTGKFYYREKPTGTFLVNRTDSIQEEFIQRTGMIVEFDISWQNDSTYVLKYSKVTENPYDGELADGIEKLVKTCKITRVTAWHYVEEAKSNLTDEIIYTRIYRYR